MIIVDKLNSYDQFLLFSQLKEENSSFPTGNQASFGRVYGLKKRLVNDVYDP